ELAEGQELLRRLAGECHFLIESFPPGYLADLGLGYEDLRKVNPALVMVSITPFGQGGPYAHYRASDLVGMALGGFMYLTGDGDRAPLRVSFPQFYLHGGAAGAAGAMLAHSHRVLTGTGQHVDVSCQQSVAKTLAHAPQFWDLEKVILKRQGAYRQSAGETTVRITWRCKDGYVNYMPGGGAAGSARSVRALLAWMDEEGMGDEDLKEVNWEAMGYGTARAEIMEKTVAPFQRFFLAHTQQELAKGSVDRRILLFPVATPKDLFGHPQLEARSYFKELPHPELNDTVTYPGAFVRDNEGGRVGLRRRPPRLGEHNEEVYRELIGLPPAELANLSERGVI
ncbi:MAG: CoA transferase, partial [Dehalococcoidia bacterium]